MADWYINDGGQLDGPFTLDEMRGMLEDSNLKPGEQVQQGNSGTPKAARDYPELMSGDSPRPARRRRQSSGGTSRGLIIAMVIGGVLLFGMCIAVPLIALLLPAVQATREAARRSQCQDHLHNFAIAVHNYEGVHKKFPPGWINTTPTGPNYGWGMSILPFAEQKPYFDQLDPENVSLDDALRDPMKMTLLGASLDLWNCPSDTFVGTNTDRPFTDTTGMTRMIASGNYIGNNGVDWGSGLTMTGILGKNSSAQMRDITDGTSNTFLAGERSFVASGGLPCGAAATIGVGGDGVTIRESDQLAISKNGVNNPGYDSSSKPNCFSGYASLHPGVAHMTLCDAKVTAISENVDPNVFNALAGRNDGLPVSVP